MAVYYYEGSPIAAPVIFESNEPVFSIDSSNLSQQQVSQGAQRWELSFELQYSGLEQNYFVNLVTNVGKVRSMIMPQLLPVDKTVSMTETPTTVGLTNAGAKSITILATSSGKRLPKGSFVQFSNHNKLYLVVDEVITNAGNRTVNLFPALYSNVPSGTTMKHPGSGSKPLLYYFPATDNLSGIKYEDGVMYSPGTIKLKEAF